MRNNSRIIAGLSLFISIVLLARLLILFPGAITRTDTPGIYLLLSVASLVFFFVAFFFLFKYITNKYHEVLTYLESIIVVAQFISVIFLVLQTMKSFSALYGISYYLGYILLVLGIAAYYKTKHCVCISFISWGLFILLWSISFYYGVYGDGTAS